MLNLLLFTVNRFHIKVQISSAHGQILLCDVTTVRCANCLTQASPLKKHHLKEYA